MKLLPRLAACVVAALAGSAGARLQHASAHLLHYGAEFSDSSSSPQPLKAAAPNAVRFKMWLIGGFLAMAVASGAMRMRRDKAQAEGTHGEPLKAEVLENCGRRVDGAAASSGSPQPTRARLEAAVILLIWLTMSPFFIIYNKWLFSKGGFPYPVTLTAMHMCSCFVVFGGISWLPRPVRSKLMPDVDTPVSWELYLKGFLPAALFMAVGLGFGNIAFLHASVVFIQVLKPVTVAITSFAGFAWGLEVPTASHLIIIAVVCGGVMLAAFGGVEFSLMGLVCQLIASTSEGLRLIVLQGIMQTNVKMDPLTTVYRFAPLAGLALCALSCAVEKPVDLDAVVSYRIVALNCAAAVLLNVVIALVIAKTSAVVSTLAGVTKDIITISASAVVYSSPVSLNEWLGFGLSLVGILMYKVYKDNLPCFLEGGFLGGWWRVLRGEPPQRRSM